MKSPEGVKTPEEIVYRIYTLRYCDRQFLPEIAGDKNLAPGSKKFKALVRNYQRNCPEGSPRDELRALTQAVDLRAQEKGKGREKIETAETARRAKRLLVDFLQIQESKNK